MIFILFFLNLGTCFTTKNKKNMAKNYFYKVNPVLNSCLCWCVFFVYIIFGTKAIIQKNNSFLHININYLLTKNFTNQKNVL